MRFVNLIVILHAIRARTDPIQPRDFDLGGDFNFGTASIEEDLSYTPTDNAVNLADAFTGASLDNVGFSTSDIAFAPDSGLGTGGFSAESLDLANLIPADTTSATPDNAANVFSTQPETPAIVADVPITGLGVTDGALIASADLPSNSIQFGGFVPGSENIEPFTPGPGAQDILNAADNPSFSTSSSALPVDPVPDTSASSLDNLQFKAGGFVTPPEGVEPFTPGPGTQDILNAADKPSFSTSSSAVPVDPVPDTSASSLDNLQFKAGGFVTPPEGVEPFTITPGVQDILNAAEKPPSFSTSDSPIVVNANIGSSVSSTDNTPQLAGINPITPGPGNEVFTHPVEKPFSGNPDTFASTIDGTPFGVNVNPATLSAGDLSLTTFKAGTETLATDVKLPPDMQEYFDRITKAPLTQDDWKIISGNLNIGGESQAPGSTASSQTLSAPATQALRGITLSPQSQRTLQSNTGFDLGGIGSNFLKALITVAQTAIQKAVIQNGDSVVTQRVAVPVPVTQIRPVAVPVTLTLVRGVLVPVTVISTLPGGVVTRILILPPVKPTPSTLLTSKKTNGSIPKVTATKTSTSPTHTPSPSPVAPIIAAAPGA